ncbi:MAG TPA: hypothetical protein VJ760_09965, partial [Nitrospiraceae bacterium]|nr:hypothetical protein [Nitrospiraceae bacterium]
GDVNKLLSQGLSTEARKIAREEFGSLGNNLGLFQLDTWQFGPHVVAIGQAVETDVAMPLTGNQIRGEQGQLLPNVELSEEQIEQQIAERLNAKKKKNFAQADEIRKSLASHGIVIEDKPDGTSRWKR